MTKLTNEQLLIRAIYNNVKDAPMTDSALRNYLQALIERHAPNLIPQSHE